MILPEAGAFSGRVRCAEAGVFALAPTGLLNGRRVTTHWRFAAELAGRFPQLKVDANALYIRDGKFYTSAGVTAGIDLSPALIEEDFGAQVALAVARELVVYVRPVCSSNTKVIAFFGARPATLTRPPRDCCEREVL